MPVNYNINPATQSGQGAYGTVPGAIGIPPSLWDQLTSIYPGAVTQGGQALSNISNELSGQLSPETLNTLKNKSAAYGIDSGTIGSQFQGQQGLTQLGLNVEQTQRQGGADYLSWLQGQAGLQTDPALAASIADRNATLAAAPNPQAASEQAIKNAEQAMAYAASLSPVTSRFNVGGGGSGASTANPAGLPASHGNLTQTTTTSTGLPGSPAGGTVAPYGSPTDPFAYTGASPSSGGLTGYTDPATGNFITGTGTTPPLAGGYDPNLAPGAQFDYSSLYPAGAEPPYAGGWDPTASAGSQFDTSALNWGQWYDPLNLGGIPINGVYPSGPVTNPWDVNIGGGVYQPGQEVNPWDANVGDFGGW